ncbi:hypothetical protein ACTQ4E_10945 [Lawsonibacter sp. LCP25S3_G6]|uniref:hypothetical protein n=1 Tax=unclassified Lawsonibacter TaxID=2617946 RepID=UPI003F99C17E
MKTVYYATSNFIRHEGNLVDLSEFRRKLALTQEGSLAPKLEHHSQPAPVQKPQLTLLPSTGKKRGRRREWAAWVLDACASLGVIVMTLSFALNLF